MTLSAGSVSIGVSPDTKGFGSSLRKGILGESSGLGAMGKVMGGALLGGLGLALAGLGAVFKTGFDEAKDASAGTAQLAAGIKSTGNAAKVSVDGLNKLASSIQGYSGQTDDSIVASEKLLLTFTKIKNNGPDKIFDQATIASANMAAKFGGDASGSAIQLGKALNDPVKGITALSRVGVSFTEGQKKSIAAMVKMGDTAGAQKIILGELNTEFGGAAKAAGESLPGQMAKAKRSFEDVSQSVVSGLIPVVMPAFTKVASVITEKVMPAITNFVTGFTNGTGAGGTFAKVMVDLWNSPTGLGGLARFITGTAIPAIKNFAKGFQDGTGPGGQFRDMIAGIASFFTDKLIPAVTKVYQTVLPALMGLFKSVTKTMEDHKGVIDFIKAAFKILGDFITSILLPVLTTLATTFLKVLGPAFRGLITIIEGVIIPGIKLLVKAVLGIIGGILEGIATAFGWIPGLGPKLRAASADFDAFRDRTNAALDGIKDKTININIKNQMTGADLPSALGGKGMKRAATGAANWRGGPLWVGENGPERLDLPAGSQVHTNAQSMAMASAQTIGDGATSADIKSLGDRIGAQLDKQARTIQMMQRQMGGAR